EGVLAGLAEALDQAVADRECGEQRDLLRGDRRDERLKRVRRERRPEPRELRDELPQDLVAGRERREGVQVELEAEQLLDDRADPLVERLDGDAARRSLDPHLATLDDTVEAAFVPEVRAVRPERAESLGREREVERLGNPDEHAMILAVVEPPLLRQALAVARELRFERSSSPEV